MLRWLTFSFCCFSLVFIMFFCGQEKGFCPCDTKRNLLRCLVVSKVGTLSRRILVSQLLVPKEIWYFKESNGLGSLSLNLQSLWPFRVSFLVVLLILITRSYLTYSFRVKSETGGYFNAITVECGVTLPRNFLQNLELSKVAEKLPCFLVEVVSATHSATGRRTHIQYHLTICSSLFSLMDPFWIAIPICGEIVFIPSTAQM